MRYEVRKESFDSLAALWRNARSGLAWDCIFVLPGWLKAWWQVFGAGSKPHILSVWDAGKLIGIAPLKCNSNEASIIGSANVCDWLDFVIAPGMEADFLAVLMQHLKSDGVTSLDLAPVLHDSTVWCHLPAEVAQNCSCRVVMDKEDVLLDMDLPASWDVYLDSLPAKQRRELRRKISNMENAGSMDYRVYHTSDAVDVLLDLFDKNKSEKAAFMTPQMSSFFRALADSMAGAGLLNIGVLTLDEVPVAVVMCFAYDGCEYLYNSAYDGAHGHLSVGFLSKIMCIKDSIEKGYKKFNFLKGAEAYKYRLGGKEVPVYSCKASIT
ncbi:MAG: GNAT family N-acetyltransferase [Chloroflexi bacterium]|jgi:CelD/BcsL family acetyltransferase involved in cellulose biosynthesis|nr:GNAT family N-acetyltransferase [Chloroflexota bacterium]MBT7081345.1 GNAT family N-acetyltransferase [Chloroflexota bacterium]